MNIEDLTLKQIREINTIAISAPAVDFQPFKIGKAYLIRTVTMIDIGIVKAVGDKEIVLSDASWIADTGRFHDALKKGVEKLSEVEPFTGDVIIGRGAIIDAVAWDHELPSEQK